MSRHPAVAHLAETVADKQVITWMARIGYTARGLVFLIIGGFALVAALGSGRRPQNMGGALQNLFGGSVAGVLMWVVAAGLMCFAGWRLAEAFLDAEQFGSRAFGLLRRSGFALSGIFYVCLAATIALTTVTAHAANDNQAAREWTRWALKDPLGRILVAATALGFVLVAIMLAVKAVRAPYHYRRRLKAGALTREAAVALGAFGNLTRAVVFLMIGAFLAFAVYDADSRQALGLSGALQLMQDQPYGGALLASAALGFCAFGTFEMIEAATRRVRSPPL